jgi:O-antigen ligase
MKGNKLFNFLCFLLIFPFCSIFSISLSFYVFLLMLFFYNNNIDFSFNKYNYNFILFGFIVIISSILVFRVSEYKTEINPINLMLISVRYFYWLILSLFVISNFNKLNLLTISKYFFLGTLCLIYCYFFFDSNYSLTFIDFKLDTPRNFFIYTLIISVPFSLFYLHQKFKEKGVFFGAILFSLTILLTNGRAGTIIVFIQMVLILGIIYPQTKRFLTVFLLSTAFVFYVFSFKIDNTIERFGNSMSVISPRVGNLLLSKNDGDLNTDKSWLIRKLMVEKGKEIATNYLFFGVGPNNFINYSADIRSYNQIYRLSARSKSFYNELSSHNSYILILAEFGIFGFFLFINIIFSVNLFLLRNIFSSKLSMNSVPLISLLGASIQFYVISSITGAISWFIISLGWMLYKTKNSNFIKSDL